MWKNKPKNAGRATLPIDETSSTRPVPGTIRPTDARDISHSMTNNGEKINIEDRLDIPVRAVNGIEADLVKRPLDGMESLKMAGEALNTAGVIASHPTRLCYDAGWVIIHGALVIASHPTRLCYDAAYRHKYPPDVIASHPTRLCYDIQ